MEKKEERNLLEKITFGGGLLILTVLFLYLGYEIYQKNGQPPELSIRLYEDKGSRSIKYRVEVENIGEETAEGAIINFDFYREGKVTSKVGLQIDYVPVRSMEEGFIVFPTENKAADSIVVGSLSYIRP